MRALLPTALVLALASGTQALPRTYTLAPSSRIEFHARTNFKDFQGEAGQLLGWVRFDPDELERSVGLVALDPFRLSTGDPARDKVMRDRTLQPARFPSIVFEMRGFRPDSSEKRRRRVLGGTIDGSLALHGIARELESAAEVEVDPGRGLRVRGSVDLDMRDHGIEPPRQVKFFMNLRVEPVVTLRYDLEFVPLDAGPAALTPRR